MGRGRPKVLKLEISKSVVGKDTVMKLSKVTAYCGFIGALMFVTSSCSNAQPPVPEQVPEPTKKAASELKLNREKWAKASIKDYRYTFKADCFCPPDYTAARTIEVREGKVQSVTRADGKTDPANFTKNYGDMEYVFDLLEKAVGAKAQKMTVKYDPEFGYPASISIDYRANVSDDEIAYSVTKFEVVQ